MKPPPFAYDRPSTLTEALSLLDQHGDDAKVLAGGQSLVPLLNFRLARPERLVDINELQELDYIRQDGVLRIGAMTRMADLHRSRLVEGLLPLLTEAASHVAHFQIRNRGTVGGSVAHADPAAEIPAALLALDASFVVRSSSGERTVAAADFWEGLYTTALAPEELVTEITVPCPREDETSAFEEFSRRSGDFAIAAVACQLGLQAECVSNLRMAAIGLASRPIRLSGTEQLLAGSEPDVDVLRKAVDSETFSVDPTLDPFVRQVVVELAARAFSRAKETAQRGDQRGA